VLSRNGDIVTNGGVPAVYIYNGINLANGEDRLFLFDSSERVISCLSPVVRAWREVILPMSSGTRLRRAGLVRQGIEAVLGWLLLCQLPRQKLWQLRLQRRRQHLSLLHKLCRQLHPFQLWLSWLQRHLLPRCKSCPRQLLCPYCQQQRQPYLPRRFY